MPFVCLDYFLYVCLGQTRWTCRYAIMGPPKRSRCLGLCESVTTDAHFTYGDQSIKTPPIVQWNLGQ